MIEARGLSKRFGDRAALREVSFTARPGELLAVIGPNGAGKTTLLSILAGIRAADSGSFTVPGEVGWVPQGAALYQRLTVVENLRLFARLEGVDDLDGAVDRMLAQTGPPRAGRRPGRNPFGRQPAAGQHRDRPALLAGRPAPRRALDGARPAPARAAVGVRARPRGDRDDGDLLDPPPPGGRALRRPAAGARRRRSGSSTAPRLSSTPRFPAPRTPTSRSPSSASCARWGTRRGALAAAQGPADPAPLAADRRPAGRLPDRARGADRLRALGRQLPAARRLPERDPGERHRAVRDRLGRGVDRSGHRPRPALLEGRLRRCLIARGGRAEGRGRRRDRGPDPARRTCSTSSSRWPASTPSSRRSRCWSTRTTP